MGQGEMEEMSVSEDDDHLPKEDTFSVLETLMLESLAGEHQRYESMQNTSGRMVAGLSLVSVALVTATPLLLEKLEKVSIILLVEFSIEFGLIIASLFCAVLVQYRRSYQALNSPKDLVFDVVDRSYLFKNLIKARLWMEDFLEDSFCGMKELNDWMGKHLRTSCVLLMTALILILVFGVIDVAVYFENK